MKKLTISGFALIASILGCEEKTTQVIPQIPPLQESLAYDSRFENLSLMQERFTGSLENYHPHKSVRIDYDTGRAMVSYTYDPRRGDVILFLEGEKPVERPRERDRYISAVLDEKLAGRILKRYTAEKKEDPIFLEEERRFNADYDIWLAEQRAHKK